MYFVEGEYVFIGKKISVIIMTLNAEQFIEDFLKRLKNQTVLPDEILVVDSESNDNTISIVNKFADVKCISVSRSSFDHGGTRDLALRESIGDYVLFFSQDAVIITNDYISNIISNFKDDNVAMVYGRQIARDDAYPYEKLIREFNYPPERIEKTQNDIPKLGIKCFYMSDVCSAYRRNVYLSLGGFDSFVLINEDMLIATKAINAGYKVIYDFNAQVCHSHNYTFMQELRRNFDIAVFLKMHEGYYSKIKLTSEGFRLVKYVVKSLLKEYKFFSVLRFVYICFGKYIGNKLGANFKRLPKGMVLFLTSNKRFWNRYWEK